MNSVPARWNSTAFLFYFNCYCFFFNQGFSAGRPPDERANGDIGGWCACRAGQRRMNRNTGSREREQGQDGRIRTQASRCFLRWPAASEEKAGMWQARVGQFGGVQLSWSGSIYDDCQGETDGAMNAWRRQYT
ncbi:hypothetical protein LY78DRAFT_134037 [Colletotrichum sublineola]|nr:hypothetical protein LY78DRAFT_134037 [Colletotrichum sublineola]